ncbi:hypothetical protein EK21DRAFT_91532 [Setomelanomma holmii]|uniref:Uncharacterized protein n=1 Tax=Setomelanomma holmii TaxID=210430 RepID=A0A9P4H4P2_9PLEO|nr:hypothetical protein EK21DRAFT_91532 [Setomelanomma holmii]
MQLPREISASRLSPSEMKSSSVKSTTLCVLTATQTDKESLDKLTLGAANLVILTIDCCGRDVEAEHISSTIENPVTADGKTSRWRCSRFHHGTPDITDIIAEATGDEGEDIIERLGEEVGKAMKALSKRPLWSDFHPPNTCRPTPSHLQMITMLIPPHLDSLHHRLFHSPSRFFKPGITNKTSLQTLIENTAFVIRSGRSNNIAPESVAITVVDTGDRRIVAIFLHREMQQPAIIVQAVVESGSDMLAVLRAEVESEILRVMYRGRWSKEGR